MTLYNCGDSRLSELLTIYERVDLTPDWHGLDWCSKHQVSLPDLQELVRLKRIRIILPHSAAKYPSTLIESIAEVDRSAIVLSRALAAKTIEQGQKKDPFLYAPLTSGQRAAILSGMSQIVNDDRYRGLLTCYGELFSNTTRHVHDARCSRFVRGWCWCLPRKYFAQVKRQ